MNEDREWEDFAPDADQDDRKAATRARAAEILARTEPTEAELLEQQERARANRIARIMAPSPPPPPVIVKIRPDALQVAPDRDGRSGSAGVAARSARRAATPTPDREAKLVEWWATRITDLLDRLAQAQLPEVTREFLRELAGLDVAAARRLGKSEASAKKRHRALKRRVKGLEQAYAQTKQAKPRVRVPAGRLPSHTEPRK